ncbi:MAG: SH3 domain-containing protein, partial [Clostridia bacterium]|nr:SH3 domain-containing protein [Clostridia bacterium]
MKRTVVAILALMMALALCSGALASTVVVTGDANARSNPSLNGYKLGVVTQGSWLTYRNVYSVDDRGVMWYGIIFDGEEAWISSRYSYVIYDDEEDDAYDDYPVVYVHRDSHVRDEPGLYGDSLTVARAGSV